MTKRVTQGSKQYKYAIKKLSIGVVSVATGASILLYSPQVLAQESSPETGVMLTQVEPEKQATEQLSLLQRMWQQQLQRLRLIICGCI